MSAENNISCMTSLDTTNALVKVLESLSFSMVSMNEMKYCAGICEDSVECGNRKRYLENGIRKQT